MGSTAEGKSSTFDAKADETAAKLRQSFVTSSGLASMDLPPRPRILGEWLREGDLGFVYAARGVGKSWLAMLMAHAIAEGESLGEWTAGEGTRRVLYLDAEMNLPDTRERSMAIGMKSVVWIQNEIVFKNLGCGLNVADPLHQAALERVLVNGDVFLIDNLSTSALGMEENSNDDWELVRDWLLRLRQKRVTVVIVHHAGRNGAMRGASRREDMAHWVIKLTDAAEEDSPTSFLTRFTKCRTCRQSEAPPLKWRLHDNAGSVTYDCRRHNGIDAMLGMIVDELNMDTAGALAEALEVSTGCVSKWAKKLASEGKIKIEGRKYLPANV